MSWHRFLGHWMTYGTSLAMVALTLFWMPPIFKTENSSSAIGVLAFGLCVGGFLLWLFRDFESLRKPSKVTNALFGLGLAIACYFTYQCLLLQLHGKQHRIMPITLSIVATIFFGGIPSLVVAVGSALEGVILFHRSFSKPK